MTTNIDKFVKPSLIGQQLYFMTLCRQKRFNLLQTINAIKSRDRKFLSTMVMAMGLINEEWNKETLPLIQELAGGSLVQLGKFDARSTEAEYDELLLDKLVGIMDGLVDTIYVCASFLNMFGFPGDEAWDIVQERNVAKAVSCDKCQGTGKATTFDCNACEGTGKVVERRVDGKILKPEGWYPPEPELKKLLLQKLTELRDGKPDWP